MKRLGSSLAASQTDKAQLDSSLAMVNIVLLLIFFFIASGSLLASREVTVQLPLTSQLSLDALPQPLLEVATDGAMLLDGLPVPPGTLAEATIDAPVLYVLADRDSNAISLLETLEAENLIAVELRLVTIHRNDESGS